MIFSDSLLNKYQLWANLRWILQHLYRSVNVASLSVVACSFGGSNWLITLKKLSLYSAKAALVLRTERLATLLSSSNGLYPLSVI